MDLPVSSPPSSAIVEAVGPTQLPILTVEPPTTTSMAEPAFSYMPSVPSVGSIWTPSLISALNMTSSNENEQDMRPIINNIAMHIHPVGSTAANEESPSTIFLEQDAPSGSYSIDIHSMEGTPIISSGLGSFVPASQSVLSSTPSTVMTMAQLIDLMPWNESYIPSFTSASSSVNQNSGPDMWQLQGDPSVGQPVPAFNQSTLPGIQMGHGGLSTNQNSWNRLIIPDRSQPTTGMQQLGVNNNTSSVDQNSGPDMWQLQGDPSVGQPVPALNQSTLSGIQTGHSGPSTNQNSWNRLIIADRSQPTTGMQQLGVNNNTSSVHQNSGPDMWQLQGDPSVRQPVPALGQSTLPGIQTGHSGPSTNHNSWNMLIVPDRSQPMTGTQQPGVNNTSSVNQNSGPDMWQLQGYPSVGQPVPAFNQCTLPGIQTGHSGPSTNENSWNMLIIPDRSQPTTGLQQLGVNNNTSSVHQNSGPDMCQLQGDPSVGQSVPTFHQSTLPSIQTEHSGLSMNQNSLKRLIIPDRSQPMTGVQQLGVNNNTSSVHQNSSPGMWQLQGDPSVGQPVAALGQSTLPGILTGHSGPSMNENSWNRLNIPDRYHPMTGLQQLGVNKNTSSVHQNLGSDTWQLQGDPSVGQPVPASNQSTLPGIQMGHSGPSTNQNSWNRLIIPDISQPMTGMQQLGVNNNTSSVNQNSGPDMWQLQGDPSVGQPVPTLNQSTLPGIHMGHSGPSTNQNSWNRLAIPEISQPMTGVQQLGVNNNTTANMPHSQPRTTASRSEVSRIYKGYLYMRREGQLVFLTRIEGFTSGMSSGMHPNWPRGLQILRLFNFNQTSYRDCIEMAGLIPSREMIFRVTAGNRFLQDMQEENICAVIELPWAMLYLFVSGEVHLEGVVCPTSTSQQLEQMLRGALQGYPPCQKLFMLRLLQQDPPVYVEARRCRRPNHGEDGGEYQRELDQFQRRYIGDIRIREGFRRLRQEVSSGQQERRRLYQRQHDQALANPLLRPEMRQLFSLQSQLQDLEEQVRQLQQRIQQLGQLHQEPQIGRAGQPALITEYEWSRRVIYALYYNA